MPYIGRGLEKGNYLKLDDISSQFDGSKTTFNLTVGGSAHVPGSSYSLLVSLSGIIQEGEAAYTLDQNQITFAAAPQAVDDCYIISLGTPIGIGVPGDGTVSGPQFAKPFNYENFFYLDHTTQRVGIGTTVPTQSLDVYDGNIAIRDPATASQFLGFYHNRNVLKASIDKTGNNLTFENVDSGIIDFKNNGSSRVGIGSTGKIFFASDDDTYLYRPGADTLGFLVGGDEKLRINGDRVIIGLSDSNNLPTFNASTTFANVYTNNPGAFNAIAIVGGHTTGAAFVKFGDRDNERQGQIGYYNQDDSMRFFVNGDTTDKVRITSSGNVGIGTTNPGARLHIFHNNPVLRLTDSNQAADNRHWNIAAGNTQILRIQAISDAGSGGGGLFDFYRVNQNVNEFRGMQGGDYWFTIKNLTKQVGIGTTNPASPLHIGQLTDDSVTAGITLKNDPSIGAQRLTIYNEENEGTHYNSNDGGSARAHIFDVNDTEALRITADGDIYTTGDQVRQDARLTLKKGHSGIQTHLYLYNSNGSSTGSKIAANKNLILDADVENNSNAASSNLIFHISRNEKARIDSNGRILIGHDTNQSDFHGPQTTTNRNPLIQLHGGNASNAGAALISWSNNAGAYYAPALYLAHSGSDTKGTNGILPTNGEFGSIVFSGDDGTNFVKGAMIKSRLDGTPGTEDMPGRLEFYTTPDGAKIPVERLRIDKDGDVGIGTQTVIADKKLSVYGNVDIDSTHATLVSLDVDNRVGMANTAGAEQQILNLRGDVINNQQLIFKNYRLRDGTDWTSSTFRIQKVIDVTEMGYIDFGTGSGTAGRDMQFGNGNGTVYMHFDSSQGHVGIGTTAPRQKFEVIGTIANGRPTFQHESGYGGLQIAGPAMGSGASLFFTRGYASSGTGTTTFSLFMAGGDQSLNFVAGDASEYLTKTKMMIENTGFVGIGTRNPDEELHVYGTSGDPSILLENGGTGTSDDTIIKCAIGDTTANNYIYFGDRQDSNVGQIRYNHDSDFMTFTTNATERVRIHDDGRVNIGGSNEVQLTNSTSAILYLHGAIVGANLDQVFGERIILDDDDTGTVSGGDRERGCILAQFNGNASGGGTADEARLWNIHSDVNCTADYDNVYGLYSDVRTTHSSGTCSAIRGVYAITQRQGSGNVTDMVGVYGISQNTNSSSGNINDIVGGKFKANHCAGTGTGTATDLVGVWGLIDNDAETSQPTGGKCALFYGNYDKTTNLHNPQGIRIDTDVPNYFRGGLAIGQSSNTLPTGKLDVEGDVNVSSGEITVSTPEFLRVAHTNAAHNQTIADNDTVVVQFGSEYDDTKNGWSTGSANYYTIQKTGYFLVTTQAVFHSNSSSSLRDWALGVEQSTDSGNTWSLIQNNGGRGGGNDSTDTDTITPVVTFMLNFTAGTRIRVRAYANTDGGTWQIDEDLGDTSGGSDYGGSGFDNQKGTRLHIMRLH